MPIDYITLLKYLTATTLYRTQRTKALRFPTEPGIRIETSNHEFSPNEPQRPK